MKRRWAQLLTTDRLSVGREGNPAPQKSRDEEAARTEFSKDADRIVFSTAFRRLSRKTQVHPLATNDHIHSRLTHSLEVASVGRSLGNIAGEFLEKQGILPEGTRAHHVGEIVHAACLAHDIGNPPFGHAGESALQNWFQDPKNNRYLEKLSPTQRSDFNNFDGNAQSFRIVTVLENNYARAGMRLTYPTLAAMVKYPTSSHRSEGAGRSKFGFYESEKDIFLHMAQRLGLEDGNDGIRRHPLSFLSEAADDICYSLIDLEDAREMKILSVSDVFEALQPLYPGKKESDVLNKPDASDRRRVGYLRTLSIGLLVDDIARTFIDHLPAVTDGTFKGDLISASGESTRAAISNAKKVAREKVFKELRKTSLEIGAYTVFERLLETLIPAVYEHCDKGKTSFKTSRVIDLLGESAPPKAAGLYGAYQAVIDFVAGMTDDYATFISNQFAGSGK